MGKQAEDSQFYQGKVKVMDDYMAKYTSLRSSVGGQNFFCKPGFMREAATMLELGAKLSLSDLNYKVMVEAINRELAQTEFDYGIAYKEARIAFELNKQTLLAALDEELADLKSTQSLSEEEVSRQFVELDIRKLTLISTKTSLDIEKETAKQELERTKRLSLDEEASLAAQREVTATKKLSLISQAENLITAETKVLTQENANYLLLKEKNVQDQLLLSKGQEVSTWITKKAEKLDMLSLAVAKEVSTKEQILAVALLKAGLRKEQVDKDIALIEADKAVEALRLSLLQASLIFKHLVIDGETHLTKQSILNMGGLAAEKTNVSALMNRYRAETLSGNRGVKEYINSIGNASNKEVNDTLVGSDNPRTGEVGRIITVSEHEALRMKKRANIAAASKITTNLVHILS